MRAKRDDAMRVIRGRRAVITGAASGIGRAVGRALAAEGADLFLIDRDAEGLTAAVREAAACGVEARFAVCDLAVAEEITRTIAHVLALWDRVHILANCAGIARFGAFHLATEPEWRQLMAINLMAPMQIVHGLLGALLIADEAHILNVCSIMGLVSYRKLSIYQASKFGLVGFTLALRNDYHRENFGVTALCPGFVHTPLLDQLTDPERHKQPPTVPALLMTTADKVAVAAISAIRHNKGLVVLTPIAKAMWLAARFSPGLAGWIAREGWRRRGRIERAGEADHGGGE
jgi:3-oxoacyl-[acyl-carrier protein] reductase